MIHEKIEIQAPGYPHKAELYTYFLDRSPRGIASNHGDPEHLWNGLGMGYTLDGFPATK